MPAMVPRGKTAVLLNCSGVTAVISTKSVGSKLESFRNWWCWFFIAGKFPFLFWFFFYVWQEESSQHYGSFSHGVAHSRKFEAKAKRKKNTVF